MALTDVKVKNSKPAQKPRKLADGEGMYLLVTPSGGKCWRLKYRWEGKEKTLALKGLPRFGLSLLPVEQICNLTLTQPLTENQLPRRKQRGMGNSSCRSLLFGVALVKHPHCK